MKGNRERKAEIMKTTIQYTGFTPLLVLALTVSSNAIGAEATEMAGVVKEKIQNLRNECAQGRHQIMVTSEELNRLIAKNVELRPQFEKYKAELVKMEEKAESARKR